MMAAIRKFLQAAASFRSPATSPTAPRPVRPASIGLALPDRERAIVRTGIRTERYAALARIAFRLAIVAGMLATLITLSRL
jgi:hypothetical protein